MWKYNIFAIILFAQSPSAALATPPDGLVLKMGGPGWDTSVQCLRELILPNRQSFSFQKTEGYLYVLQETPTSYVKIANVNDNGVAIPPSYEVALGDSCQLNETFTYRHIAGSVPLDIHEGNYVTTDTWIINTGQDQRINLAPQYFAFAATNLRLLRPRASGVPTQSIYVARNLGDRDEVFIIPQTVAQTIPGTFTHYVSLPTPVLGTSTCSFFFSKEVTIGGIRKDLLPVTENAIKPGERRCIQGINNAPEFYCTGAPNPGDPSSGNWAKTGEGCAPPMR
jgi:hypothetical protein